MVSKFTVEEVTVLKSKEFVRIKLMWNLAILRGFFNLDFSLKKLYNIKSARLSSTLERGINYVL